jgi:hypothetical protein
LVIENLSLVIIPPARAPAATCEAHVLPGREEPSARTPTAATGRLELDMICALSGLVAPESLMIGTAGS